MGKKKPLRINPDHSDRTADWLKLLPQAKEDQAAGEQVIAEKKAEARKRGRASERSE